MLRTILTRMLASKEKSAGYSTAYMRFMVERHSPRAFFTFLRILKIVRFRRKLPLDAHHVARILAARSEDCGECVQLAVRIARADGVPREVIEATVRDQPAALPENLRAVYTFTREVTANGPEQDTLREPVRRLYGDAAIVELSLTIAAARFFPMVKRVLGFAGACRIDAVVVD